MKNKAMNILDIIHYKDWQIEIAPDNIVEDEINNLKSRSWLILTLKEHQEYEWLKWDEANNYIREKYFNSIQK